MRKLVPLGSLAALLFGCVTHGGSTTEPAVTRDQAPSSEAQALPGTEVTTMQTSTHQTAPTKSTVGGDPGNVGAGTPLTPKPGHELAAFAGGCFWGVEDAFRKLPGVTATAVGFTGGHLKNPTYERVCDHDTGHAETVLVEFDPVRITYAKLLKAFFQIHDPTTLDRQGPDVGDQYRSEIFTFSSTQADAAKAAISEAQKHFTEHVVTKVEPIAEFWKAEDYHQQYAEKNGYHGCPTGKLDGLL
jgi:peptide-methionine (S)-S-oxide reductase